MRNEKLGIEAPSPTGVYHRRKLGGFTEVSDVNATTYKDGLRDRGGIT